MIRRYRTSDRREARVISPNGVRFAATNPAHRCQEVVCSVCPGSSAFLVKGGLGPRGVGVDRRRTTPALAPFTNFADEPGHSNEVCNIRLYCSPVSITESRGVALGWTARRAGMRDSPTITTRGRRTRGPISPSTLGWRGRLQRTDMGCDDRVQEFFNS